MSYNNIIYCNKCLINNKAHSFSLLETKKNIYNKNISVFYTCPGIAEQYDDTDGILNHYKNFLNFVNPDEWIWIFDCNLLSFKHCFEIKTACGIIDIIKKNNKNKKIIIINCNMFTNILFNSVILFLDDTIKNNIIFFDIDKEKEKDKNNNNDSNNLNELNNLCNELGIDIKNILEKRLR